MKTAKITRKVLSVILCLAMLLTYVPFAVLTSKAATKGNGDGRVWDEHTLHQWKDYFGTLSDNPNNLSLSTEYAGGVWTDKSVFSPDSIPEELTRAEYNGATFHISDKGDNFLVSLSAIASNKEITGYSTLPTDTVFILDLSSSMRRNDDRGQSALDELADATNKAITDLLELNRNNRIAVVLYAGNTNKNFSDGAGATEVILPLDTYDLKDDGKYLEAANVGNNVNWALKVSNGVNGSNGTVSKTKESATGTFMQDGIYEAMRVLLGADPVVESGVQAGTERLPIMVLMTDGEPTLANNDYDGNNAGTDLGTSVMYDYDGNTGTYTHRDTIAFMTMLTAAYAKKQVSAHYGSALFYTLAYGEAVTTLDEAISVMDPDRSCSTINAMWSDFLADKDVTVYRYRDGWTNRYYTAKNAQSGPSELSAEDKFYVNEYFPAKTDADFARAFDSIVNEIIIQSKYYPTYVENDYDHDGYLTFVDKIGDYMEITDVKGIVVGDRLFSGAAMASAFSEQNSSLGTVENPTALGDEFIGSIKERLCISDTAVAQALVANAYSHGQLSYTSDTEFSHYIGWFSDSEGNYVDFWHEGMTESQINEVASKKGATHIIKSYGFLGDTTVVGGVSNTDMMYMTVRVATEIATDDSIITWRLPASLIPTVTYEVSVNVDEGGNVTEVTDVGLEKKSATDPIRLLYEVELYRDIYDWNLADKVSADYAASTENKDAGYVFYTNKWTANADNTTFNTYSHFEPSVDNERYYYTEDSVVYADANGTVYKGAKPENATFYRQYAVYEKLENGTVRSHFHYEPITEASLALAEKDEGGEWIIPKGTVHRYYDFENSPKVSNETATMGYSDHPFIVATNDHYYTYSTQGNNGKLYMTPATGLKLTKTLTEAVEGAENVFTFVIAGDIASAKVVRIDENGYEASRTELPANGEIELKAGETVYVIGLTAGQYTVTEKAHKDYSVSAVTVDGVNTGYTAEITVEDKNINDVQFVNAPKGYGNLLITKEIHHVLGNHSLPVWALQYEFEVLVNVGANLAGEEINTLVGNTYGTATVGNDGTFVLTVKHGATVELLGLPEGTEVAVAEITDGLPEYFEYDRIATRDHTGMGQDSDGNVTIYADQNATAVVYNTYIPEETDPITFDIGVHKVFNANGWSGNATFEFKLQQWAIPEGSTEYGWVDVDTATLSFTQSGEGRVSFAKGLEGTVYDRSGEYAYQIVEVIPANGEKVPGVTYDRSIHTFTVVVLDVNGKLVATLYNADGSDAGNSFEVTFTNEYHTAPLFFDIIKNVVDASENAHTKKAGFEFLITEEKQDDTGAWIATGNTYTVYSDAVGEARFAKTFEKVDGGTYPEHYRYAVAEQDHGLAGWVYDSHTEYVYASLETNGEGEFVAHITDENGGDIPAVPTPTFTNTYDPADAELNVDAAVKKELVGRDLLAGEFTFALFESGNYSHRDTTNALLIGTNGADGSVDFEGVLTFDKVGTYEYDIVEIVGNLGGVTYTERVYDMVVEVADNENGALEAVYYFEDSTDGTVTFTNVYSASPASTVIEGNKVLTGRPLLINEFKFRLTEVADAEGTALAGALVLTTENGIATNGKAELRFDELTYSKEGTHYYKIEEIVFSTDPGVTYAENYYIIKVTVTDNGEGSLVAQQTVVFTSDGSNEILFTNTYKPAKVETSIHSTKELSGKVLAEGQFSFTITETEGDFETVLAGGISETVKNTGAGTINFPTVEFTEEGVRYFVIEEINEGEPGITYDSSKYLVSVMATDNLKGALVTETEIKKQTVEVMEEGGEMTVTIFASSIVFTNAYTVSGDAAVTLSGTKTLNGVLSTDRSFGFKLYEADSNYTADGLPVNTVQSVGGFFEFELTYGPEDISDTPYYYVVREENAGLTIDGVTYDNTEYYIEVTVSDDNEGGIDTDVVIMRNGEIAAQELSFANTYDAEPTSVVLTGEKELLGDRPLKADDFTFEVFFATDTFEAVSSAAPSVKNDANGNFTFDAIDLNSEKTYYFVVRENSDDPLNGVTYDTAEYHVTVDVYDNGRGALVFDNVSYYRAEGENETAVSEIVFKNSYKAEDVTVSVEGTKTLVGRTLAENEFKFLLTPASSSFEALDDAETFEARNGADGRFVFDAITYSKAGTYYYIVAEDETVTAERVTNDTAEYYVTIEIKDDGNGNLYEAGRVITKGTESVEAIEFVNVFTPGPEDITVDISVIKTVVNKGSEKIGPEGFEFVLENIETNEKFTLESDENGNAVFSLAFTEDNIGETLTYVLTEVGGDRENVQYSTAVYEITVTVSLSDNNELVADLTVNGNGAEEVVAAFENVYDYTPEPEKDPDEKPEDQNKPENEDHKNDTQNNPQTGEENIVLWLALLFICGSGIVLTTVLRKRKENE